MNHRMPPNPDLEALPTELHALYGALTQDGAAWRRESPDPQPRLDAFVRDLAARPAPGTIEIVLDGDTIPLRTPPGPRAPHPHPHRARRRGLLAVAAMAAVVALLVALFATMLPPRQIHPGPTPSSSPSPAQSPSPHGTATPAITAGPSGVWQALTALTYSSPTLPGGGPAIAPSNPLVVYEPVPPIRGQQASLRRTEDGGKSWVELSLPSTSSTKLNWFGVLVSPLDARSIILVAEADNPSACPPATGFPRGFARPGSGIGPCVFNYASTDAGSHWQPLNVGVNMGIGLPVDTANSGLIAQGTRLYATGTQTCAGEKSMLCTRILTSTDSGASWAPIDRQITTDASQYICDWAATPRGETVFAAAGAEGVEGCSYYPRSLTLWRSDDHGVTWARVGTLPAPNIRGLAATGGGTTPITLYANLPATVGTSVDNLGYTVPVLSDLPGDLRASTDGGKTWQQAPTAGIGGGLLPGAQPVGVLSNASLLMPFTAAGSADGGNPAYYAWAAGAGRWTLVASPDNLAAPRSVLVTPIGGHDVLWVVVPKGDTSSGEYDVYEYTI